jgi:hypothetical protein
MTNEILTKAVKAIKAGDKDTGRKLILQVLRKEPKNLPAWLWAMEVVQNDQERKTVLEKILDLDPEQQQAKDLLERLEAKSFESISKKPESQAETSKPQTGGASYLLLPLQWLFSVPSSCGFIFLALVAVGAGLLYFRTNTSFFGLIGTDFDQLQISNSYQEIVLGEQYWKVQFEGNGHSKFIGKVRYAGPIREKDFPILTHDILVTSADYANPDLVHTSVADHKFFWRTESGEELNGYIHLLHTVPANKQIYQQLLQIRNWDTVRITGREIFTISAYNDDGEKLGTWQDAGCNTLLVESVSILRE